MKVNFTDLKSEFEFFEDQLISSFKSVGKKGEYVFGSELNKFETNIKKFLKVKYVLGVGNWTEGMVMVCKALNLKKNDEIITVSNSFIATCGAIAYSGCKPVLVDVDSTMNINPDLIQKKINKKTKVIMPVHLSGIPVNINKIKKICRKNKLVFIEDAAHAFGGKYNNRYLGTLGDIGIFSLHPRKNFHVLGDGGLIVTNNKNIYEKLKLLRNHGLKNRNLSKVWGTNSRLDNLQAAFGNIFLKSIKRINKKFLKIANYYTTNLNKYVETPKYDQKNTEPTFHQYIIRTSKRNNLKKYLASKGVQTSIHYPIPIHKQEAYKKVFGNIILKNTEEYSKQILSLPIHYFLTQKQLSYVCKCIKEFFRKN
ncbi:DegT/DnrJ/EryC1/StrS family aminotransferase [Candidatus Pelagibacter sp. HIMB1593]|uniref:DegT/DnrJ/EryC1/StrS family aminotransferase n=1 Tax=Candidatus Pelagibacter sp. HIMB1593 TaxID=3413355 RepID=UPI003F825E29